MSQRVLKVVRQDNVKHLMDAHGDLPGTDISARLSLDHAVSCLRSNR